MKAKIFFAILLFHVTLVNCAVSKPTVSSPTVSSPAVSSPAVSSPAVSSPAVSNPSSSNLPITQEDSKLAIATGLVLSQIDLIACIFVLVRTFLTWKNNDKNPLPMSLRFPFYIASLEIWVSIIQTIKLSNSSKGSGQLCSFTGLSSVFLIGSTGNLVTFVIFIVWYKVKKNIDFNSGRYDYILFISSAVLATFYTLLGVGEYGPSKFWCSDQPSKKPILYMILVIILIHTSILLILYVNTRINLIRLNVNLSSGQSSLSERDLIISKKVTSYALPFIFQLLILLLCAIIAASVAENSAVHLLQMLGVSIGGFLTALQYIMNEGWRQERSTASPLIEKHPGLQSAVSSLRDSFQRLPFTRIQVEIVQQQTTIQSDVWTG